MKNSVYSRLALSSCRLASGVDKKKFRWLCSSAASQEQYLFEALKKLDTATICDADKALLSSNEYQEYQPIKLLDPILRPLNSYAVSSNTMVGFATTARCSKRNDFLAVLRGLMESSEGHVLMVDTSDSNCAVAGELFSLQAVQKGLAGIVVDGPMRDTAYVQEIDPVRVYATSVTPYSGTTQSPGDINIPIQCGGVQVHPGEIVVGDNDGILVASIKTLRALLPQAQSIQSMEAQVKDRLLEGESLAVSTNYKEHLAARLKGDESSLAFKV